MYDYTSKQLYMVNGGQKLYIYKDGFGDIYNATPAEEAEWSQEVIANALVKIDEEQNPVSLEFAISNLLYHKYQHLISLLLGKVEDTNPARQIVFASALWKIARYEKSFNILYQNLQQCRSESLEDVFMGLNDFKDNRQARDFLIACLEGDDEILMAKAQKTLSMWWWSGMTLLKENNLVDLLNPENRHSETFALAIGQVKQILKTVD